MRKILIVEDEEVLRDSYVLILSTEPYLVEAAEDGERALQQCATKTYDLILLDLMMPRMDGLAFLKHYKRTNTTLPKTIILSNLSSGEELEKAMRLGAHKSAVKADLSPKQLLSLVRYELQTT